MGVIQIVQHSYLPDSPFCPIAHLGTIMWTNPTSTLLIYPPRAPFSQLPSKFQSIMFPLPNSPLALLPLSTTSYPPPSFVSRMPLHVTNPQGSQASWCHFDNGLRWHIFTILHEPPSLPLLLFSSHNKGRPLQTNYHFSTHLNTHDGHIYSLWELVNYKLWGL